MRTIDLEELLIVEVHRNLSFRNCNIHIAASEGAVVWSARQVANLPDGAGLITYYAIVSAHPKMEDYYLRSLEDYW
jgi:hypothetical protein